MADFALEEIDLDHATELADRANRLMVQHGVAPTPANFAVWFSYSRGVVPELKRTIDILIAGNKRFDSTTNRQLFSTYLATNSPGADVNEIPDQLNAVMTEAKRYVTAAVADNRTQVEAIAGVGEEGEKGKNGIDPRSSVECRVNNQGKPASRTSRLEINLSETSRELDTIRESLS